MKIKVLTTEGDVEGKTTRTVGYFIGTINQIITYCVKNNIKPYYYFKIDELEITDVSDLEALVSVTEGNYHRLIYQTPEDLIKEGKINAALSKLTEEEKKLLGVNK